MANSLLADVSYNTPEKMVARKYKITLLMLKILHSFKCSLVNEKYIESFYFLKKNKAKNKGDRKRLHHIRLEEDVL